MGKKYSYHKTNRLFKKDTLIKYAGKDLYTNELTLKVIDNYPVLQVADGKAKTQARWLKRSNFNTNLFYFL